MNKGFYGYLMSAKSVAEDTKLPKHESLEEHRKHCKAKEGNCPFERNLKKESEKATKEDAVARAPDSGREEKGKFDWSWYEKKKKAAYGANNGKLTSEERNLVEDGKYFQNLGAIQNEEVCDKVREFYESGKMRGKSAEWSHGFCEASAIASGLNLFCGGYYVHPDGDPVSRRSVDDGLLGALMYNIPNKNAKPMNKLLGEVGVKTFYDNVNQWDCSGWCSQDQKQELLDGIKAASEMLDIPVDDNNQKDANYQQYALGNGVHAFVEYMAAHPEGLTSEQKRHAKNLINYGGKDHEYASDVAPWFAQHSGNLNEGQKKAVDQLVLVNDISRCMGWEHEDKWGIGDDEIAEYVDIFKAADKGEFKKAKGMPAYIDSIGKCKAMILSRLEDCNFHTECSLLEKGKYDELMALYK